MADRSSPMISSPSQCPGTARSSTSAGLSLMSASAVTCVPRGASRPCPWRPERSARAQAQDQLTLQSAAAFDVERLIDRLVADPHGLIIGEVDLDPVRDLLRTPRRHPRPILAVRLVPARPRPSRRPHDHRAVGSGDLTRKPCHHVGLQPGGWPSASRSWAVWQRARPSTAPPMDGSRASPRG